MKTCFSEGKLMKQFGTPPLSTNPPISEQFFHVPPLCPNFKTKNPAPYPLVFFVFFFGGGRTMSIHTLLLLVSKIVESLHCILKRKTRT